MPGKRMKAVKAWAQVTGTGAIVNLADRLPVFNRKSTAELYLCGMDKHGYRVARIELREIPAARRK